MVPVAARRQGRGARRCAAFCGRASRVSGKLRPSLNVPQVPVTRGKVTPSRRARSSGAHGSRGATVARNRSCRRRKRSGRLVWAFSQAALSAFINERPAAKAPQPTSPRPLLHSLARARTHDTETPRSPRFVSRAPWEAHGTPADASAAEASARCVPARFARLAVGTARPPPPPPGFRASARRLHPPPSDVPPPRPRTRFPRTPTRRVSRARLRATVRTSAATTGDTSSRATTATSRISTPTARGVRICAR